MICLLLSSVQSIKAPSLVIEDDFGVIHNYGDPEESGWINISRSDGSIVLYHYEAKPTSVKFDDASSQLGEDDTVGLADTFIITFYGGALPVNGEIKTGAGKVNFTINNVGDVVDIYYYNTLTYRVTLTSLTNENNTFTFIVQSISKPGNTALSYVLFCFSKAPSNPDIEIIKKIWNGCSWVDSASFNVGSIINFKITIKNNGNEKLRNVDVVDDLPNFLNYRYDASPSHSSATIHHIEWVFDSLNISETITILFSVYANSTGNGNNIAIVSANYGTNGSISDSDTAYLSIESGCEGDPPLTTKTYGCPFYTNGVDDWITSSTPIILNAVDYPLTNPSGVLKTWYRILEWSCNQWIVLVDWTVYVYPFNIHKEGKFRIEYYSIDNCNNVEELKWQTVYVDNSAPQSTYTITNDPDHYVNNLSTLTISSVDKGIYPVRVYTLFCYINGVLRWQANNSNITFQFSKFFGFEKDGTYTIEFWAQDVLGNKENPNTEKFIVDTQGPDVNYTFIGPHRWAEDHWQIEKETKIVLSAFDSGVGLDFIKYRIGEEGQTNWILYTGPFTIPPINGIVCIYFFAKDKLGNYRDIEHLYIEIVEKVENNPPSKPNIVKGPTRGRINLEYSYDIVSTDPEGDSIFYLADWGDGSTSEWKGPYESGKIVTLEHTWSIKGAYKLRIKAKDISGYESDWSDPIVVVIPREKVAFKFNNLFEKIMRILMFSRNIKSIL